MVNFMQTLLASEKTFVALHWGQIPQLLQLFLPLTPIQTPHVSVCPKNEIL